MTFCEDMDFCANTMHANDASLLKTMSMNMNHGKISALDNLKCPSLEFELKNVI